MSVIIIIASAVSIGCMIYSELMFRQCEKELKELNKILDQQIDEYK